MSGGRELGRALLAFVALPGVVAFAAPLLLAWLDPKARGFEPLALIPLVGGVFLLLWCVRDFYVSGKGTLAPWAPPRNLVVVGLYRWSRNPMYVAVLLVLLGFAIAFRSRQLLGHAHDERVAQQLPWSSARSPGSRARTARRGSATASACRAG